MNYLAVMQTVKQFDTRSVISIAPVIVPHLTGTDFFKSKHLVRDIAFQKHTCVLARFDIRQSSAIMFVSIIFDIFPLQINLLREIELELKRQTNYEAEKKQCEVCEQKVVCPIRLSCDHQIWSAPFFTPFTPFTLFTFPPPPPN